jgi:RNA polymerase sigma-70 factor, ECF subfamily
VELHAISPSPVIALNHAVAIAMSEGVEKGLRRVDEIGANGELDDYHLFHAARADLLRRLRRMPEAIKAYSRALELAQNPIEQNYLRRRLIELTPNAS